MKTLDEAKKTINKLITDKLYFKSFQASMKKFRKEYFTTGGKDAINKIAEELK